jgi:hypothetical protein
MIFSQHEYVTKKSASGSSAKFPVRTVTKLAKA